MFDDTVIKKKNVVKKQMPGSESIFSSKRKPNLTTKNIIKTLALCENAAQTNRHFLVQNIHRFSLKLLDQ